MDALVGPDLSSGRRIIMDERRCSLIRYCGAPDEDPPTHLYVLWRVGEVVDPMN